jgi:mannitol 2-dehydrogenase
MNWAIIGSGVTEYDVPMREKLASQDFLTTLIELDPEGNQSCEIVGSMIDYVAIEKNNQSLIHSNVPILTFELFPSLSRKEDII